MAIVKSTEIAAAPNYPSRRLSPRERRVLEVSDSFVATTSTDWPAGAPTTVSGALDQLATGNNKGQLVKVTYDFSVDGGTVGNKSLALTLPNKAVVVRAGYHVLTTFTSGGAATVAVKLGAQASGDIIGSTPIAFGTLTAGTFADGDVLSFATAKKTTAARIITFTIAGAALTAGKLDIFVEWVLGT